ncbi:hypothetical protein KUCAC02_004107 [Chaenocephalus aceratus]|uniref:Uncharacterized protein n=1 Tax=Chaenocephalus aceratus TaxID=36190 RepID=A0ACB9WXR5_CHAAC|nr:hypothetical protein KUCAC02_004107 [Chaenocephalus aceratus]
MGFLGRNTPSPSLSPQIGSQTPMLSLGHDERMPSSFSQFPYGGADITIFITIFIPCESIMVSNNLSKCLQ